MQQIQHHQPFPTKSYSILLKALSEAHPQLCSLVQPLKGCLLYFYKCYFIKRESMKISALKKFNSFLIKKNN